MNEETISQEQYLFNQLNFEERKNIIKIMEYIINLQQENNQLKDKIKNIEHILNNQMDYREFVDMINAIEEILKGEENDE